MSPVRRAGGMMARRGRDTDQLYLHALEHPLRRRILRLAVGAAVARDEAAISPVRASRALDQQLSACAYHVRVLVKCHLLKPAGTRPVRGTTEHLYKFHVEALHHPAIKEWVIANDE
jgi:hypothetical protein